MKFHPGELIGLIAGLFLLSVLIWGKSWTTTAPPVRAQKAEKSRRALLEGQLWDRVGGQARQRPAPRAGKRGVVPARRAAPASRSGKVPRRTK